MLFSEDSLRLQLAGMFVLCRPAFAASCCERLISHYVKFSETVDWGNPSVLRSALNEVWNSLEHGSFNVQKIRELIDQCEQALPNTEDFASPYTSPALDAGSSVLTTLRCCLDGNGKHAVEVASLSRDTIDMYLRAKLNLEDDLEGFQIVDRHPLMVSELKIMSEDIEKLSDVKVFDAEFVRSFKANAKSRGSNLLESVK